MIGKDAMRRDVRCVRLGDRLDAAAAAATAPARATGPTIAAPAPRASKGGKG